MAGMVGFTPKSWSQEGDDLCSGFLRMRRSSPRGRAALIVWAKVWDSPEPLGAPRGQPAGLAGLQVGRREEGLAAAGSSGAGMETDVGYPTSWGCPNKAPHTWLLKTTEIYRLTVLEAISMKRGCW